MHSLQHCRWFAWTITSFIVLSSLIPMAGCKGDSNDVELERVPNVPASTRGTGGGALAEPKGKRVR